MSIRLIKLTVVVTVTVVVLIVGASEASAHTGFEASDPADGELVDGPVNAVTLVFTGEATPAGDGFQVLDDRGQLREAMPSSTDGRTWRLALDAPLEAGRVGVRWVVRAPDAHPIEGSFTFTIAPLGGPGVQPRSQAEPTGRSSPEVGDPGAISLDDFLGSRISTAGADRVSFAGRSLSMTGALVGLGALTFAAFVLRSEPRDVRYVLFWVRRSGVVVTMGALIEFVGQIPVTNAGGWSTLMEFGAWRTTAMDYLGLAIAMRAVGGLALTAGARLSVADAVAAPDPAFALAPRLVATMGTHRTHRVPRGPVLPSGSLDPSLSPGDVAWYPTSASLGAFVGIGALTLSFVFDGHTASAGAWPIIAALDVVHVMAASVWVGGVATMAGVLRYRKRRGRSPRATGLALRFSVLATVSLVAVGVAGTAMTVLIVDDAGELTSTSWGRVLLAKCALVLVAAAAGAYNHKILVPQLERRSDDERLSTHFRRIMLAEASTLLAVGIVTAWLVALPS